MTCCVQDIQFVGFPCSYDGYKDVYKRQVHKYGFLPQGVYSREDYARRLMQQPASFYYGVLWNKLYRLSLIHISFLTTKFEYYYYHTPAAPGLQERRTVAVL